MKKAVALKYEPSEMSAPQVISKGVGILADKIIEIAQEHNIPIIKSEVVEPLMSIKIRSEIPPELYQAIAEIIAYVYKLVRDNHKGA
ncbi:MAG: EscU/YscU/HrcU family type III secretion system export apparatus switch protein [Brevinematales bacterium]|nr:EscU/YscU/HrcU family type III secretion system export apparatus switch protein [Brevinematales bacterium]